MKKSIVFISPNSLEMMNMCAINYTHSLGYETAVAVDYHNKLPINTDYVIYTDTNNADTLISDLAVFNLEHEIAGITTYSDYHVEITALANEYFKLNGPSFPAVQRCKNKLLCRMELNLSGWKQPKSILIKNPEDFKKALDIIDVPCVIKPMNGLGSAFTMVLTEKEKAFNQFVELLKVKNKSELGKETLISNNWVLEECLEGFQISVESYTYHGETTVVCIHDKLNPILPPFFRVFYSATPSPRISKELEKEIIQKTKYALRTIGFDNGVSHTEFRVSDDGKVQLLEINARTGGRLIIPSVFYSTNINLYTVAIDLALGKKPLVNLEKCEEQNPVVFRVIYPQKSGILTKFSGMEDKEMLDNLDIVEKISKTGDFVSEGQRLGIVLKKGKKGETIEEIIECIDNYIMKLDINVDPYCDNTPLPSHISNLAH